MATALFGHRRRGVKKKRFKYLNFSRFMLLTRPTAAIINKKV